MANEANNFFILAIIFVMFILPLWLILYFRYKNKLVSSSLAAEERIRLIELEQNAKYLNTRLETLEKILKDLNPNWQRD